MPERATILQRSQVGPETTPGTAVAATKRLGATSIKIQPQGNINLFGPMGSKFDTLAAIGKEWSSLELSGEGSYPDLAYIWGGVVRKPTFAQQGGTSAYLATFNPNAGAQDDVQTFTVEQGEVGGGGRAQRVPYGLLLGHTITWGREGVKVSGQGIGQRVQDDMPLSTSAAYTLTANATPPSSGNFTLTYSGQTTANIAFNATAAAVKSALEALSTIGTGNVDVAATIAAGAGNLSVGNNVYTITFKRALAAQPITLTGTFTGLVSSGSISLASSVTGAAPTLIAPVPILGNQIDVYMDDTSGNIGTTKLARCFGGSFEYSGRFGPVWPVDSALPSFASHVELKPAARFKMRLAADDAGMSLLSTMRAGQTKYIRWNAEGANIASTYNYRARIDMAAKVSEMFTYSDQDGIYQVEFGFTLVDDPGGLANPFQLSLITPLTAL